jgi:hypothetical protein
MDKDRIRHQIGTILESDDVQRFMEQNLEHNRNHYIDYVAGYLGRDGWLPSSEGPGEPAAIGPATSEKPVHKGASFKVVVSFRPGTPKAEVLRLLEVCREAIEKRDGWEFNPENGPDRHLS